MRLLRITSAYPEYAARFYAARPGLAARSYAEQCAAFFHDAFSWADAWTVALRPAGYEMRETVLNVAPMQHAWARENLQRAGEAGLETIAVEQIRQFAPEILWYDHHDAPLLKRIREAVPETRLVLGWVGSAMPADNAFAECDMILSCSRESVERLTAMGHRAAELHHGFDPRIPARLDAAKPDLDVVFIGQLIRGSEFHLEREKLLEQLVETLPVRIFSPAPHAGSSARRAVKRALAASYRLMKAAGGGRLARRMLRAAGRSEQWLAPSVPAVNPKLVPYMSDGVYGLQMYQTVRDAKVTLNVHADSSDRYASNMRLFEVTGVAGCLLTDWKPNLGEMFAVDKEVVAYRSAAECIEKGRWLLEHPAERRAIAAAGQARTLREHTFGHRAARFDAIVKQALQGAAVHG